MDVTAARIRIFARTGTNNAVKWTPHAICEAMLRLARNELRYRGAFPGVAKKTPNWRNHSLCRVRPDDIDVTTSVASLSPEGP